jgi:hypothetical protein
MSENRRAWIKTAVGMMVLMEYRNGEDEDESTNETEPTIRLYLPQPGRKAVSYDLTALTEPELDAMEKFFALLFKKARPVVQQRDKVANDALERGDDSFARVYRDAPQFIVREGQVSSDGQGVYDRPEDAPGGHAPDSDSDSSVGGSGDGVASGEAQHCSSEDNGSEAN